MASLLCRRLVVGVGIQAFVSLDLTAGVDLEAGTLSVLISNSVPIVSFQLSLVDAAGNPVTLQMLEFDVSPPPAPGTELLLDGVNDQGRLWRMSCEAGRPAGRPAGRVSE